MVLGGNDREGCGDWEGIPGKMPPHVTPVTKFRPGASLNSDYHLVARVVWLILLSKMALGGFW